jgi:hypothetical protein
MANPYFSELKYLGGPTLDFIEVAVDAGTPVTDLVITIYNSNGSIRTTNTLAGITPTSVAGKDVYIISTTTSGSFTGLGLSNAVSLSNTAGDVFSFVSFNNTPAAVSPTTGPATGLTSTEIGNAGNGSSLETSDGGATYQVQDAPTPGGVPCLTAGTAVQTARGLVLVEHLVAGDEILTLEGTFRPLLAKIHRQITRSELHRNPKLFPVRISAGALGKDLPLRDLLVSRQHRMLVSSRIVERMFDVSEVLVAAIKLIEKPGIFVDTAVDSVAYFHLLFDEHEVIFAEGAPTESLLLAQEAIKSLSHEAYEELLAIFPAMENASQHIHTKRTIPSGKRQTQLVSRHVANGRDLLSSPSWVDAHH